MNLKVILILLLISFFPNNAQAKYEKSVVKISSIISLYDYQYPWQSTKMKNITGSGVIIKNKYILTAAHVVSNAKAIKIEKDNEFKKYTAKIKYISHQADLALLEIYDKSFFKNTIPLKIKSVVKPLDEIFVSGYPDGNTITINKGLISKIKYHPYSLSNEKLLVLKTDASINKGNSGGPALNINGDIIGIAMQKIKNSKVIAYIIPSFIIKGFLEDIKDKRLDGFHSNSNSYQYLENKTIQNYYNIKKRGVLVTHTDVEENQLKINDIIFKINGDSAFSNNSILTSSPEVNFLSQFHTKQVGKSISLSVIRNNKIVNIDYKLKYSKKLIHHEFNTKPRYFIFGGLVFTPITRNYLQSIGLKQYEINMLFYQQKRTKKLEEPVAWMQTKFLNDINSGYTSKVEIVNRVNNIKVKSFRHFVSLIQNSKRKYVVISFLNHQRIVLEKEEAIKGFSKIKNKNLGLL